MPAAPSGVAAGPSEPAAGAPGDGGTLVWGGSDTLSTTASTGWMAVVRWGDVPQVTSQRFHHRIVLTIIHDNTAGKRTRAAALWAKLFNISPNVVKVLLKC